MTKYDDTTALWAISVLSKYAPAPIDTGPAPRHYAPEPFVDYHAEVFKRQCERDRELREVMGYEEPAAEARDAEEFFLDEQCPSDATFR